MLKSLAVAALLLAVHPAAAQLYLFEDEHYGGRQFPALESFPRFRYTAYADTFDRAASARVASGRWQLCADADFRGRCVTLDRGDYPSLAAVGLGAGAASARNLGGGPGGGGWAAGGGPGGGGWAPGGGARGRVVLFDRGGLRGGEFRADDTIRNLERAGFNDRARSMIVYDGTWEMCSDAEFRGTCETFRPGRYDDLGRLNGRVSSLRPAPGGGWGGGGGGRRGGAVLFQGPNLTGRSFVVDRYVANLGGTGFNDRAQSLRIERGRWVFCSDAEFQGQCRTFEPGDYPDLPRELRGRISSGRRISDD
jgi:hypothetical protein